MSVDMTAQTLNISEYVAGNDGQLRTNDPLGNLPASGLVSEITTRNITWTFAAPVQAGTFINGDPWIIGNATISSVTPGRSGSGSGLRNGSVVNPTGGRQQGYDGRIPNTLNESLTAFFPLAVSAGQSIVSTGARDPAVAITNGDQYSRVPDGINVNTTATVQVLKDCEVLTVLGSIPPADAFRPPFAGTAKPMHRQSEMNLTLLSSNSLVGGKPDLDYVAIVAGLMDKPWMDSVSGWESWEMHPSNNMSGYGQGVGDTTSLAALLLCLDYSDAEKLVLATNLVQVGIDLHGMALNGTQWWSDGGHGQGRKVPIIMAGILLNDAALKAHPGSYSEELQTFYGVTPSANQGTTGQEFVAFWGDTSADGYYQTGCTDATGFSKTGRPSGLNDDACCDYRNCCSSHTWVGTMLAMLMTTGAKAAWDDQKFFDYVDRWMDFGLDPQVGSECGLGAGSVGVPVISAAWNEYRSTF